MRPPAYILSGGGSTRFGTDKARADVMGRPLITCVAESIASSVSSVTVVAAEADFYVDLGLRTICDITPGLGPLGGIRTAIDDLGNAENTGWFAVIPCDLLGIKEAWITKLLAARTDEGKVVAFRDAAVSGNRWQPLLALYHTSLKDDLDIFLSAGNRTAWKFIESVPNIAVSLPDDWSTATQINTPQALSEHLKESKD